MSELNVAIVGSGLIATKKHIPAFRRLGSEATLTTICDVDPDSAQGAANRFDISSAYTDLGELLSQEKPDLVDICTPPKTHSDLAIQAIEGGAHVLIEKPMAMDVEECNEIVEAAEQNGRKVCVAHSDLFYPPFLQAQERIENGDIGEFKGMRIFLSTPTDYMTSQEDHWAHELPGGVIGESGPHVVYLTLPFINPVQEVRAYGLKNMSYPWSKYEDYRVDLVGEDTASTITCIYTTDQWDAQVDIWGTEGMLKLDLELMTLTDHGRPSLDSWQLAGSGLSQSLQTIGDTIQTGAQVLLGRYQKTHDLLIEQFVDSIHRDTGSPVPAEEGREAVRVMNLIVKKLGEENTSETKKEKVDKK
ncbi:MAG: hypothetical protein BRD55_05635 [Bacteroidetes bacterium SW_9_63_38]|nr:MAG: hypothetical protein BRD55_05635 [Bacteroidetes bacterium SW_9_63_38]